MHMLAFLILLSALVMGVLSCSRQPAPSIDPMFTTSCDSTPMKPIGRPVEIPSVRARPQLGAVTGTVAQAETGDALQGAIVSLMQSSEAKLESSPWRATDSKGGFAFDSIVPGSYRLRVRRIGESIDTSTIQLTSGRVDTVRIRMRAYRCYGY
jgi:hypothetical protein